jgi:uncharacterized protein (DUF2132 family)
MRYYLIRKKEKGLVTKHVAKLKQLLSNIGDDRGWTGLAQHMDIFVIV